ncbi:hypothetical protein E2C01_055757 [Portunus trituberculatus]|uniref:Reverse transcriptase domain-containing protein n=1 Tax=Portunus trituberculatus TaxID=210409 RepID=A0A5B7GS47_PORTR|nr:hypothetical protein [Portunus trituberculatus]
MVSINLKDLQVPVHLQSRRFLCFGWGKRTLQYWVLCFAMSMAPQVFTRIIAPISAELHRWDICILQYLDVWLLLVLFYQEAVNSTQVLPQLCAHLGIRINYDILLTACSGDCLLGSQHLDSSFEVFPDADLGGQSSLSYTSFRGFLTPNCQKVINTAGSHGFPRCTNKMAEGDSHAAF